MECRAIGGSVAITNNRGIAVPCCITDTSHGTEWDTHNIYNLKTLDDVHESYHWFQMEDQMQDEIWPKECTQCKMLEHNKRHHAKDGQPQSTRGRINRQLTRQKILQRLHISLDYHCNLSCRSCRPGISSRWDRMDVSGLHQFDKDHYKERSVASLITRSGYMHSAPASSDCANAQSCVPFSPGPELPPVGVARSPRNRCSTWHILRCVWGSLSSSLLSCRFAQFAVSSI